MAGMGQTCPVCCLVGHELPVCDVLRKAKADTSATHSIVALATLGGGPGAPCSLV